jgi:uncharacterized OsmC-like protein
MTDTGAGIAEAIGAAREWLAVHPDQARYTDSPAVAAIDVGLHCSVSGPDGATLATDMPTSVGGGGGAPSPGWFLRAAQASCVATLLTMRAAWTGQTLSNLTVTVDSESDDRGILDVEDGVPAGPLTTSIRVHADGVGADVLGELAVWAVAHCPVTDAVRRAVPTAVSVEIGA